MAGWLVILIYIEIINNKNKNVKYSSTKTLTSCASGTKEGFYY
jgi:hypothetical protein